MEPLVYAIIPPPFEKCTRRQIRKVHKLNHSSGGLPSLVANRPAACRYAPEWNSIVCIQPVAIPLTSADPQIPLIQSCKEEIQMVRIACNNKEVQIFNLND
jgi:hypothetical protein